MVRAGQIKDYITTDFYNALTYYNITKTLGNPNGGIGWVNENLSFVISYLAFEQEENVIQKEEMDRKQKEAASKTGKKGRKK